MNYLMTMLQIIPKCILKLFFGAMKVLLVFVPFQEFLAIGESTIILLFFISSGCKNEVVLVKCHV